MSTILYNGRIYKSSQKKLSFDSNWAKFAPGFYETMKLYNNTILHWQFHWERMQKGAAYWQVKLPRKKLLKKQLLRLAQRNRKESGRIRVQFNASLSDQHVDYIASIVDLAEGPNYKWLSKGWNLGLFDEQQKVIDGIDFKSNHKNIYLLASKWAKQNKFDDALVLNSKGRITDSTMCNLCWIEGDTVFTPPAKDGGVGGTFIKFLQSKQQEWDVKLKIKPVTVNKLRQADEIFLTNVIRGIRWVKTFEGKTYGNEVSKRLFKELSKWEKEI